MASTRSLMLSLVLLLLVFELIESRPELVEADAVISGGGTGRHLLGQTSINCGSECLRRCQLSSRPNLCKRACGTCCARCSCVPPGTSGNYEYCPCYATMTTHDGVRKCP